MRKLKVREIALKISKDSFAYKRAIEENMKWIGNGCFIDEEGEFSALAILDGNGLFMLKESPTSDAYEKAIADNLDSMPGVKAERPKVSTKYSDVLVTTKYGTSWLEVKMNHKDNLGNVRVYWDGSSWKSNAKGPIPDYMTKILNSSSDAAAFIKKIAKFSGIKKLKLPTTKGGLTDKDAVPLEVMKKYFDQSGVDRYVLSIDNIDLGKIVTAHYIKGKAAPAYYLQAADDFYMIGKSNPLKVPSDVPLFKGTGKFRVRVSTRSQFYEIQPEIKIDNMPNSKYSVKKGSKKKNPFESLK